MWAVDKWGHLLWGSQKGGLANLRFIVFLDLSYVIKHVPSCLGQWFCLVADKRGQHRWGRCRGSVF